MSSTNNPNNNIDDDVEGGEYIQESDSDVKFTTFLCLGICDMRIATMFVNAFNVSLILVGVLVMGIRDNLFWKAMGSALAAGLPGLLLSGVGFYGAKNFELWAMYLASAGFLLAVIMDAVLMAWVSFIITGIVLFPHAVLTLEMRNGLITEENYSQQEYLSPQGKDFVERAHAYIAPSAPAAGDATPTTTPTTESF